MNSCRRSKAPPRSATDGTDLPRLTASCMACRGVFINPGAINTKRLNAQLEQQDRRFVAARSRKRFAAKNGTPVVSQIFDWCGKHFETMKLAVRRIAA